MDFLPARDELVVLPAMEVMELCLKPPRKSRVVATYLLYHYLLTEGSLEEIKLSTPYGVYQFSQPFKNRITTDCQPVSD